MIIEVSLCEIFLNFCESTLAINSLVVVFPFDTGNCQDGDS